mmetsp:Transcript_67971/g.199634  ORF Transcript_67971/g.199634 Transcript_67971/m.199634 type:complete len:252 (+) Transcript_67971:68-823(+)
MDGWKRALLYAGGAAGAAAVLYYLLREEPESKQAPPSASGEVARSGGKKLRVEDVTKEQVQQILNEIVDSQEKMKAHMKALTDKLLANPITLEQTYHLVRDVQPDDPLERHGLTMMDFDQLLSKYQSDPQVREGLARIMGAPDQSAMANQGAVASAKRVIEVHAFMLQELEKLVQYYFTSVKNKEAYDMKTVTLALQAIVGAKVQEKFDMSSEDIEMAVIKHHSTLATDQEFERVNMKMQMVMAQIMGAEG